MSKFAIERGIPMPKRESIQTSNYPFIEMLVGESFAIPEDFPVDRIRAAATQFNKRKAPKRVTVLKTKDGYRCWRVE